MSGQEAYDAAFQARFDGAAISTYILAMLSVPAKIWCKTKVGGWENFGWDDGLSIVTLFWANIFFWDTMIGIRPYLGKHAGTEVSMEEVELFSKCLYAAALSYVVAIGFIKFTILAFYWKLFSIAARWPIRILFTSVAAWVITFLCLGAFGCQPIQAQWDLQAMATAKCLPQKSIYLGGSLPNVIVDFFLVIMPLPYVWRLNVVLGQRLILAGMFALGIFICIVSIVRLTSVLAIPTGDTNVTYNLKEFMLWSVVEINIGLVCSCLPSLRRLAKLIGLGRLFSQGSSAPQPTAPGRTPNNDPENTRVTNNSYHSRLRGSKSRGLWSSITGLTKIDSEEDAYQMIDHAANPNGRSTAGVEAGMRTSGETSIQGKGDGVGEGATPGIAGLSVQRTWSVKIDDKET